jgi:xanthine dehydrogenase YagS FAD-binding subunit
MRQVPVEEFHARPSVDVHKETVLEPGELVAGVVLPRPAQGLRSSYRKVRARRSWDFALAGVALAVAFEEQRVVKARVVLSGAAPVPWRVREAETAVKGSYLDPETVKQAAAAAVRDAQPLEQNAYKIPLFRNLLEEQLGLLAHREGRSKG